jgi:hypothetical protein
MRTVRFGALAAVAALVTIAGIAGRAGAEPRLVVGLGATGASSDGPQKSGLTASAAALWSHGEHLELGPMLFIDDLGTRVGRLVDPNNGTDLGSVAENHRVAFGGAWRFDVPFGAWAGFSPRAISSWGYYRIQEDRVGVVRSAISTTGWSLGGGMSRGLSPSIAIGVSAHYHGLQDERQNHYVSATVDLSWMSPAEGPRTPRKATP